MPANDNKRKLKILLIEFILCIIGAVLLAVLHNTSNNKTTKKDTYISCFVYSQTLVESKLKSPKSASFPFYDESFITDKGDTIIVSAYVEAENSFGVNIKTNYKATITILDGKPKSGTVVLLE